MKTLFLASSLFFLSLHLNGQVLLPGMPDGNGRVNAIVRYGTTVFVGGEFTTFGGLPRQYLAAFDANTGAILPWDPSPNGYINSLLVADNKLLVGGGYTTISGVTRKNLTGYDLNGMILLGYIPIANSEVFDLKFDGTKVYFPDVGPSGWQLAIKRFRLANGTVDPWLTDEFMIDFGPFFTIMGNYIYVGGDFQSPIGGITFTDLARFDLTTGAVDPTRVYSFSSGAWIEEMLSHNNKIYIVGSFTMFNSFARKGAVELDSNGGVTSLDFHCSNSQNRALFAQGNTMWVGGNSAVIGGVTCYRIAQVKLSNGFATCWQTNLNSGNSYISAIYVAGDTTYAGGPNQPLKVFVGNPSYVSLGQDVILPAGGSVTLATNTPFTNYTWSTGATTPTINVNTIGTYWVNVSNTAGCTATDSINVTGPPIAATATFTFSGPSAICTGGGVTMFASTTGSPTSMQWMKDGVDILGATTSFYTATTAGLYELRLTNACCTVVTTATTVTIIPQPTAIIAAGGSTSFCTGGSVLLTSTITGSGLTFQWTRNGAVIPGANSSSFSATLDGSHALNVTDSCGTITSNPIAVTVTPLPTVVIAASGSVVICVGQSRLLTSTTTGTGLTYQWTNNGANITGANSPTYSVTTAGSYALKVTNSCGTVTSNAIPITVLPQLSVVIAAGGPTSICTGGSVLLTSTTTGSNLTFQWTNNGANITGANSPSYSVTIAGSYALKITNTCGTLTSNTIAVTVSASVAPTVTITSAGPAVICPGSYVVLNSTTTGTGLTFQWILNGSNIIGNSSSYPANTAGSYALIVSNACGTVTSNSISVTTTTLATAVIAATGPTSFCTGGSVLLTSTTTGSGFTLQWTLNGSDITGANSSTYLATLSGNYRLKITNICGTYTSNIISVFASGQQPTGTISATGPTTICTGGNVPLNSTTSGTGLTFQWKRDGNIISGATLSSYTATLAGSYVLQITNGCGTITSNAILVTVQSGFPSAPTPVTGPSTFCAFATGIPYTCALVPNVSYFWQLPQGATIASGTNTNSITVNFGNKSGWVKAKVISACGASQFASKKVDKVNCRYMDPGESESESEFSVFPNPVVDKLTINLPEIFTPQYRLVIMNSTGQILIENSGSLDEEEYALQPDVSDFENGIYMVILETDGEQHYQKFVIQK